MTTRIKICGITNLDDALAACAAGADALGFNFAEEAKPKNRYIEPAAAKAIIEQLPPFVTSVAICVNDSVGRLTEYLEIVDYVQLHGEESVEVCQAVANRALKAFRVSPDFEPKSMLAYPAAAYVLDAWTPNMRGGTGQTFDWEIAKEAVALDRPLILAGGLTPDNVAEAVRIVQPYAVDVAGGVEASPGVKDHGKLRSFIHNAKYALS